MQRRGGIAVSEIHAHPEANGTRFGKVIVTVDLDAGDCVIQAPRKGPIGPITRRTRLHSLDEIQGAYQIQLGLAAIDPIAHDIARALKFAAQRLSASRKAAV